MNAGTVINMAMAMRHGCFHGWRGRARREHYRQMIGDLVLGYLAAR